SVTAINEIEFQRGGTPRIAAHELIDKLGDVVPIESGAVSIKPARNNQLVSGRTPGQPPPPEIVSRPVITRDWSKSPQPVLQTRREQKVGGTSAVILNPELLLTHSAKRENNSIPASPFNAPHASGYTMPGRNSGSTFAAPRSTVSGRGFSNIIINQPAGQRSHQDNRSAPSPHSSSPRSGAPHSSHIGGTARSGRH